MSQPIRQIVVVAYGRDQRGLLAELLQMLVERQTYITDISLSLLGDRFTLTLLAQAPSSPDQMASLEHALDTLGSQRGFKTDVQACAYQLPRAQTYYDHFVIVAYGHNGAEADYSRAVSRAVAAITQVIAEHRGNIVDMDLRTDRKKRDFSLTVVVAPRIQIAPDERPTFGLEDFRQALRAALGDHIKFAVQHERIFRYLQRIDTEPSELET